ncbi:MAG: hypothetical protein D6732_07880 [Methanobacteriota archaeon]|nr:MAG: hypothetical protein D6732_07880 [Euryarchaeota archaeon]
MKPIDVPISLEPVLPVRNLPETLDYYTEKLGFKIDWTWGDPLDHASVSIGNENEGHSHAHLQLSQADGEIKPFGWFYFHVSRDLDVLFKRYAENGVEIVSEPKDMPWGMREFNIREINGYLFRFGQPLPHFDEA